jgi:hypothetical protein
VNNLVDKTYVHAKINALHGYLLSKEDYHEIARSGKIQAAFPEILTEKETSDIIRTKEIIFRHQIETFILLIGLNDFYGDFFRAFLLLFELSNIKHVLLRAYGKTRLFPQWNDVTPYNLLDPGFKKKEISRDELRSVFAGTLFSEAMNFDEPPSYEVLESNIDFLVLKNLLRFSRKLFPADMKIYNDTLTRKIISMKFIWDRRSEKHHEKDFLQFNPEYILYDAGITEQEIEPIEKDISKKINAGYTAAGTPGAISDNSQLELLLLRLFMSYVNKLSSKDFHSICPVLSYGWSLYYQIVNLFMIIEGLHLRVSPEIIMQRLICRA